jgi:hypothetical protein
MRRVNFGIACLLIAALAVVGYRATLPDPVIDPPRAFAALQGEDVEAGTILLRSDFENGIAGWSIRGDANTVWISNGALVLGVDEDANGVLHEGRIDTDLQFTYGTFRARIRSNPTAGPGAHWALWAQSVAKNGTSYFPGASEIDVVESFRADRSVWHTIWETNASGALVKHQASTSSIDQTVYHNYLVQWTPTGYTFKVDGVTRFTTSGGLSDDPHFGVLSYLVADWELQNLDRDRLGQYRVFVDFAEFKANQWTTVS